MEEILEANVDTLLSTCALGAEEHGVHDLMEDLLLVGASLSFKAPSL